MYFNTKTALAVKAFQYLRPFVFRSFHVSCNASRRNYYEVLSLTKTCSSKDIRDAFLNLSKKYHPDRNSHDPANHARFVELNEAYSVLGKPGSRSEYDQTLTYSTWGSEPRNNHPDYKYTVYDVGDATSYENFEKYYYSGNTKATSKPRVASGKFAMFILAFSIIGGILQFYLIRWIYRNAYKEEIIKHRLTKAAYLAQMEFLDQIVQQQNIRTLQNSLKKQEELAQTIKPSTSHSQK